MGVARGSPRAAAAATSAAARAAVCRHVLEHAIWPAWEMPSTAGWLDALVTGLWYAVPVMTILLCHEMGHFIQAYRYGVYASLPYFMPLPFSPFGTLRGGDRDGASDGPPKGPVRHRHHRAAGGIGADVHLPDRRAASFELWRTSSSRHVFWRTLIVSVPRRHRFVHRARRNKRSCCSRWRLPAGSGC